MSQYFEKPYEPFGGDIKVKVDLSNYATKADIKNISHVDTLSFALKINLASLKAEFDKLVPVPVDLSKLSDVVKNDVVKKTIYDILVTKVKSIDASGFVLKTNYDTNKSELENKSPDTSGLVKKTDYDAKIAEIESKITDVTNLAKKTALTTVENKVPDVTNLATETELTVVKNKIHDVSSLVKKTDYNSRVAEIDNKVSSLDDKDAEKKQKMCLLKTN